MHFCVDTMLVGGETLVAIEASTECFFECENARSSDGALNSFAAAWTVLFRFFALERN